MNGPISHRAMDALLRDLEREKKAALEKLSTAEAAELDKAAAEAREQLEAIQKKKQELTKKVAAEKEDLERLQSAIVSESAKAAEEARLFRLQQRIEEFRGNDNQALRERLISEGFDERLIDVTLRRRTLDAQMERAGGLEATFAHRRVEPQNPLERIMDGTPKLYDMTDARVLDRLYDIRRDASERGYLSERDRHFVENVEYHAQRFQENDVYRGQDDRGYITRAAKTVEDIKRELGIANDPTSLSYRSRDTYQ
jgi:hypothetical protein